jgi:hypothetical protein
MMVCQRKSSRRISNWTRCARYHRPTAHCLVVVIINYPYPHLLLLELLELLVLLVLLFLFPTQHLSLIVNHNNAPTISVAAV